MRSQTKISVQIGPGPSYEFSDLKRYTIDSNVLTLADACNFDIANPSGRQRATINLGDPISVFMEDPTVNGGSKVQVLKGLVTGIERASDEGQGSHWTVDGADIGWHLVNNCGPLWKGLMSITFEKLLKEVLDQSWGFQGVRDNNDANREFLKGKLNNARAAIAASRTPVNTFIPPVCFEAGDAIADKLILYAKRAKRLVNVSADGYLQFFQPRYDTAADFALHYHKPDEDARKLQNCKSARVRESIDGIYTDIRCVGTVPVASVLPDRFNPHAGMFKGQFRDDSLLPFYRLLTFSDSDALSNNAKNPMANDRALWKAQRGQFDGWQGEYVVEGHAMGGVFIAPDAMCGLNDTVNGEMGNHYISARRFERSEQSGTITSVTLRRKGLLRA